MKVQSSVKAIIIVSSISFSLKDQPSQNMIQTHKRFRRILLIFFLNIQHKNNSILKQNPSVVFFLFFRLRARLHYSLISSV